VRAFPRGFAVLLVGVLTLTGCTTNADEPDQQPARADVTPSASTPAPTPSTPASPESDRPEPSSGEQSATPEGPSTEPPAKTTANPVIRRIPDPQWRLIERVGAWRPGCPAGRSDLRRVAVNYVNFDGKVERGALVVNKDVAESVVRIFTRLFEERFPIRRMKPVELYDGDVNESLAADNTSAFNCRQPNQINAPVLKSPHANGRAIDINPRENPWTDLRCDCWLPSPRLRERTPGKGKILKGGLVWRVFRDEGWVWQNIDVPDYMHFDTGYPSKHYRGPEANKRLVERQQKREEREERREERRERR
jgi:hypothetical protein